MPADRQPRPGPSQLARSARITLVLLAVFVAAILLLLAGSDVDAAAAAQLLSKLSPLLLVSVLGLSLVNYGMRALRWHWYSDAACLGVPLRRSLQVYIAGFSMGVTPGRFGEIVRLWMLRREDKVDYHRAMPLMLADRVNDLMVIIVICLFAVLQTSDAPPAALLPAAGIIVLAYLVLGRPRLILNFIDGCYRVLRRGRRLFAAARRSFRTGRVMFSLRVSAPASVLGLAAWMAECIAFWLLLDALGAGVPLAMASFIYAFATLVGALSFLPGGLGGFEVVAILLLKQQGVDLAAATLTVTVIRLTTLWFSVALGGAMMGWILLREDSA